MVLYFDDEKKEETGRRSCFFSFSSTLFLFTFTKVTYTMTFL